MQEPTDPTPARTRQQVTGVEVAQVRALVDALADVDADARIALTLADDGVLSVRIDPPDRDLAPKWLAVDTDARVMRSIGPTGGDR